MADFLPAPIAPRSPTGSSARVSGFRTRLFVWLMLIVSAITALALYIAERNLAGDVHRELQRDFESELTALHNAQEIRHAALVERCRALVSKPRIHAALEDDALDLLYPSAADELRDLMHPAGDEQTAGTAPLVRARFYRFLDHSGRVIKPPAEAAVGSLHGASDAQLALPSLNRLQQVGYISGTDGITEIITTPIISTETGEVISALTLGFRPFDFEGQPATKTGIWIDGALWMPGLDGSALPSVAATVAGAIVNGDRESRRVVVSGTPHLLFFNRLNSGSSYPTAYEVVLYPLDQFAARENRMRLRVIGLGGLLLLAAFVASRMLAVRLARPVEKLAADSERSARFSADASHQLKTPVTVLRAGLEELLTREHLSAEDCDAIAALIHQTYRLSSLIDDLLLLSRMDSGRLKLTLAAVDLAHLIAAALDDLSAIPDDLGLKIETDVPATLQIIGERRYTAIILQNLLENARKYNRRGGKIRILARIDGPDVFVAIGNTGGSIGAAAQAHIFERFHRGAIGENVPGYGLGLNLARELARLHEGELRLMRSGDDWTEFELRLCVVHPEMASL